MEDRYYFAYGSKCFRTFLYSSPINPSLNKNVRNVKMSENICWQIWMVILRGDMIKARMSV